MVKILKYSVPRPGGNASVKRELLENEADPKVGDIVNLLINGVPYTVRVDAVHDPVTVGAALQINVTCSIEQRTPRVIS